MAIKCVSSKRKGKQMKAERQLRRLVKKVTSIEQTASSAYTPTAEAAQAAN